MVAADAEQHATVAVAGVARRGPGSALDPGSPDDRRQGGPPPRVALGRPGGGLARHRRGVVRGCPGELHLAFVVHPYGPARGWVAGRVGGAQPGERRVERVDAAQQEGAPGDLTPARVQQAAPSGHGPEDADRPTVAQNPQERADQLIGAVRGLGLDELVPAVDQDEGGRSPWGWHR